MPAKDEGREGGATGKGSSAMAALWSMSGLDRPLVTAH